MLLSSGPVALKSPALQLPCRPQVSEVRLPWGSAQSPVHTQPWLVSGPDPTPLAGLERTEALCDTSGKPGSGYQDRQEVGGQVVAAGPAPAPWSPPAIQCKEHGPALVAPEQGCVGVEAILLDALAELAVCGVDRLRGHRQDTTRCCQGPARPASCQGSPTAPWTRPPGAPAHSPTRRGGPCGSWPSRSRCAPP